MLLRFSSSMESKGQIRIWLDLDFQYSLGSISRTRIGSKCHSLLVEQPSRKTVKFGKLEEKSIFYFYSRDTRKRDREKSSGQAHLFNIWTTGAMDRTLGQPQVQLSQLGSISLKMWLLTCVLMWVTSPSGTGLSSPPIQCRVPHFTSLKS